MPSRDKYSGILTERGFEILRSWSYKSKFALFHLSRKVQMHRKSPWILFMYLQIVLLPHHDTDPFSVSTGLTWLHFPLLSFRAVSLSSCLSSNRKLYSSPAALLCWRSTRWRGSAWCGRNCPEETSGKHIAIWTLALCQVLLLNYPKCPGSSPGAPAGTPQRDATVRRLPLHPWSVSPTQPCTHVKDVSQT